MIGRPKKEDCREKQYRVRLNEKEDDMLTFASNAIGIPKSEIFRNALREYSEKIKSLYEISIGMYNCPLYSFCVNTY